MVTDCKEFELTEFELSVLKLLHCIATSKIGWTREQQIYISLCEQLFFPEME